LARPVICIGIRVIVVRNGSEVAVGGIEVGTIRATVIDAEEGIGIRIIVGRHIRAVVRIVANAIRIHIQSRSAAHTTGVQNVAVTIAGSVQYF
jgi:hypothetical protein